MTPNNYSKPSILVVLASYNGSPWLKDQVHSILGQKDVEVRIFVGDDCSVDGSIEELSTSLQTGNVTYQKFTTPSGGAGQNFIRILKMIHMDGFDFLALSDQDDIWHHEKLESAVRLMRQSNSGLYSSAVVGFWESKKNEVLLQQNAEQTDIDYIFEGAGQGCTFVLNAEFVKQVQTILNKGGVDLSKIHYHDWMIYAISRSLGVRWVYDAVPSMRYRQHEGNDTGARKALKGVVKRINLIRSGWYKNQIEEMLRLVLSINPNIIPKDFNDTWQMDTSIQRRLKLGGVLLTRGRRRLSDRMILAVSALMGWI